MALDSKPISHTHGQSQEEECPSHPNATNQMKGGHIVIRCRPEVGRHPKTYTHFTGAGAPYHEPKGGCSWDCVRDICSGQQRSVHTMSGRPMAAHRVKFLILFTYAVRKFFWFPPPKARDLMPISHTPLEPFVDNDAFTVIDSKTCTKIPASVYGSPMCFHCMVSRKRMKPQRSVLLQLKYFFMLSSCP